MTHNRLPALFLAAALLFPALLGGCGKKEKATDPAVLANRFEGTVYPSPEGDGYPQNTVPPLWDEATGTVTYYHFEMENVPIEDNKFTQRLISSLVTADENEVLRRDVLPLPDTASIQCGWLNEERFTYLFTIIDYDNPTKPGDIRDYYLGQYDRATGEVSASESITRFFDQEYVYAESLCTDRDGDIFVGGLREILLFSPDFLYRKTVRPPENSLAGLGVDADGNANVLLHVRDNDRFFLAPAVIDKEKGTADERFRVRTDTVGSPCFGPGRDLYYVDETGILGVTAHADGSADAELLMDFNASDVSDRTSFFIAALGEDRFLFIEAVDGDDGQWRRLPVLYRRAEDRDLSEITTLTVAYCNPDSRLAEKIVAFNKAHRDIRLLPEDYSQYNTPDDAEAGAKKLAMDMATGVFQPDIVVGSTDSEALRQIREKKLYTDLAPYIAGDDLVNEENLFGAVRQTFDDGAGGVWGLASSFELMTLVSTRDLLGEYADREYWSFSEMTDYVASLPEDVVFFALPCREVLEAMLLPYGGYREFLDTEAGTCSFDGPAFRRYLDLALSLPSYEEAERFSPMNGLDPEEQYLPYLEGKVALREFTIDSPEAVIGLPILFGTDDPVLIGLPTAEKRPGAGIVANVDSAYVVASFCKDPDAAWTFVRSFFEGSYPMMIGGRNRIPALRSQLDEMLDLYERGEYEFVCFYDGNHQMRFGNRENPTDPASFGKPCLVSFFEKEHKLALYEILDIAGASTAEMPDERVAEIIGEELSAFFAGASAAGDCAARIQSRVSLWLAEHR